MKHRYGKWQAEYSERGKAKVVAPSRTARKYLANVALEHSD